MKYSNLRDAFNHTVSFDRSHLVFLTKLRKLKERLHMLPRWASCENRIFLAPGCVVSDVSFHVGEADDGEEREEKGRGATLEEKQTGTRRGIPLSPHEIRRIRRSKRSPRHDCVQ